MPHGESLLYSQIKLWPSHEKFFGETVCLHFSKKDSKLDIFVLGQVGAQPGFEGLFVSQSPAGGAVPQPLAYFPLRGIVHPLNLRPLLTLLKLYFASFTQRFDLNLRDSLFASGQPSTVFQYTGLESLVCKCFAAGLTGVSAPISQTSSASPCFRPLSFLSRSRTVVYTLSLCP